MRHECKDMSGIKYCQIQTPFVRFLSVWLGIIMLGPIPSRVEGNESAIRGS